MVPATIFEQHFSKFGDEYLKTRLCIQGFQIQSLSTFPLERLNPTPKYSPKASMPYDSFNYLSSKSRNILPHGKILVLFLLAFLMLLPAAIPAPAKSPVPTQISSQTTSAISPNVTPDFSMSGNPASVTTTPASTRTTQITLTSIGGFTGQVYMFASSFSLPAFPLDLNPSNVSLSSGTASSTLTITVPSNASPGPNTVFIDSTGGCTLFHFLEISVNVTGPDFTVTSEKTQMTLAPGGSDTAKIDLTSLNGFSGSISLNSFSQFTTSFNPSTVTLSPGGTSSSILTVTAPIATSPGNYTVSVEGSLFSSFLFHSADIQVTVTGQAIVMDATQHFLTLIVGGASNSSTITVKPTGGFTGQVTLTASPQTPLSPSLSNTTVTLPPVGTSMLTVSAPLGTKAQSYFIVINGTGTSSPVHSSTAVIVQVKQPDFEISVDPFFMAVVAGGSPCTSTVSLTSVLGFTGNVGLALKGSPNVIAALNPTTVTVPGTSTLTVSAPSGAVPGFYTLEVNGTSSSPARTHSAFADILVIGPDFALSANPDPLTIMAGSSGASTISLTSILGFSGTVSLTASSSDPELIPTLSQASISGSQTSTLSVAVAPGTVPGDFYSVQVNGTSGQLTLNLSSDKSHRARLLHYSQSFVYNRKRGNLDHLNDNNHTDQRVLVIRRSLRIAQLSELERFHPARHRYQRIVRRDVEYQLYDPGLLLGRHQWLQHYQHRRLSLQQHHDQRHSCPTRLLHSSQSTLPDDHGRRF